jgi:hypothetical protein
MSKKKAASISMMAHQIWMREGSHTDEELVDAAIDHMGWTGINDRRFVTTYIYLVRCMNQKGVDARDPMYEDLLPVGSGPHEFMRAADLMIQRAREKEIK